MKKSLNRILVIGCLLTIISITYSCDKDFLEIGALGSLSQNTLANKAGVNGLLIGAYSTLDGVGGPAGGTGQWVQAVSNWIFSGVASDDAHKGSEYGDEAFIQEIENFTSTPVNPAFNGKWLSLYTGAQRANDVLRILAKVTNGSISPDEELQIRSEALFLRAVYHFEAYKLWRNVPYLDEKVNFENGNYLVNNTSPIQYIETDLLFAADNLSETKNEIGRANKWAAKSLLAKVYMFQNKFTEAKALLTDIIEKGVTSSGDKYDLVNFADNFNPSTKNGAESVFAVQMSVNDNANGANGNVGDVLNFAAGGPANCCGFHQPSFSLVNSFKTDPATGLPLLDTWNDSDIKNDQGIATTDPFSPYTGTVDPRLDWTAGRRGVPYLDWGIMPGASWIVSQAAMGPYIPIKNVYYQAQKAATSDTFSGWASNQSTSNNYNMIRFADVLLWAAEVEVEIGSLDQAEAYVNRVRARAAKSEGWVKKYVDDNNPTAGFTNDPAANYKIGLYSGHFAAQGKDFARKAVRFERKLELAMEGHRFFDLQRYDNGSGYMASEMNNYIEHETTIPGYNWLYMNGAEFVQGKNEVYPIPQAQIDLSVKEGTSVLKQNPSY